MDKEIKQMFEIILNKLDTIEKNQDSMQKRQELMEIRQDEIFELVKAIEHSNKVKTAEIDNLNLKVARIEGIITGIGELITN